MVDFPLIERRFGTLLISLEDVFSTDEAREAQEFLDVGEYGLALETICAIVTDERQTVGANVITQVKELETAMGINSDIVAAFLKANEETSK